MSKDNTEENKQKATPAQGGAETVPVAEAQVCENGEQKAENDNAEAVSESDKGEVVLTQEDIKTLLEKAAKVTEYENKMRYLVADFENFKKRSERKRQEDVLSAKVAIVETVLPVLDNFEMAFAASLNVTDPAAKSLQTGIEMVLSQFHNVLRDCGVVTIEPKGEEFDHSYHEAISEQVTDEVPDGHVAQVLRKGYRMGDRLIRAAKVVVARKAEAAK